MINKLKNAITIKKLLLVFAVIIFVVAGMTGCKSSENSGKKTEGEEESNFRKQMANVSVSEIAVNKDLVLESPVEVKGTKVIYGEGSITAVGDDWTGDAYMIVVPANAQLTLKGSVSVNAKGLAGGIHAVQGATWNIEETASVNNASAQAANTLVEGKFTMNGGTMSGAKGHNVYNKGEVTVSDGEIIGSGEKYAGIYSEGTLTQNGGTIRQGYINVKVVSGSFTLADGSLLDADYHGVENAGNLTMTGGVVRNSYNCGVVNTGTLEITGGSFIDNANNKAVLNMHNGKATISGDTVMFSGNRYAIANQDTATIDLSGGEFLLTTVTNVYAYDGTVNIHDISLGASGSNNVRIYKAEVTMNNVQVLGNSASGSGSTHGILLEGGVLNATDLTIRNVTGYGIRNKGGQVTAENLVINKSSKAGGISNNLQDYTGVPGVMDIKNLTIENIRYNNIVVDGGTVTVTKGNLAVSGTNNVKTTAGTLNLTDVDILGNLTDTAGTNHAVYMTGGTIVAQNVNISNARVSGLRINGETALFSGNKVTIKDSGKYGIQQTIGTIKINNLTMSGNPYNIDNSKGTIKLSNSTLGPTKSNNLRTHGGLVDLQNVNVNGHTKDHVNNVHALFVSGGTLTGKNVTVRNVANVGLRLNEGTVNLRALTVVDAGADGVWVNKGKATLYDLQIKKAGGAGISVTDTGIVSVVGGNINNTSSHGTKSENSANLTLKDVSVAVGTINGRHAVLAQGGDIHLENVTLTGLEGNTAAAGIRINRDTSHVSGKGVSISGVNVGVSASAGTSDISGVTTQNINSHGVLASDAASLIISDSTFGVSGTNNTKAMSGGKLTLNQVVINGTTKNHGVMAEDGGYIYGKDITVRDTAGAAVRVKCGAEGNYVEIDGLVTENIGTQNIHINKDADAGDSGGVVIKNGDLGRTGAHNIQAEAGTLTLVDTQIQGHLEGTANNVHAIYVTSKAISVELQGVTVLDAAGDALRIATGSVVAADFTSNQTGRYGIWATGGELTGQNVTVSGSQIGVYTTGGTITLNGANISDSSANNISVANAQLTVNGYADGSKSQIGTSKQDNVVVTEGGTVRLNQVDVQESAANNIVATGGQVYVTDSTVTGGAYSILAQAAGYAQLTNVTITDPTKDGVRVNAADGKAVLQNVQIVNPIRYGISAQKGAVTVSGELTITSDASKSAAIYAYDGGKVTAATDGAVNISGTENGICIDTNAAVTMSNLTVSGCAKNSIKLGGGTAVLGGINISGGTNNIAVTAGELTVNGYADGRKSQIGTSTEDNIRAEGEGVVRLNSVNVLVSAKNNVVAINGGTVYMTKASVTGGNHSILADKNGKVYLDTVSIAASANSGIRANHSGSYVEGTDVTIDSAKTGVSFQSGTINITNITIRNTKEVGVSVVQANSDANVTLNNLVTENCGTHAIYTSGAAAKLTVKGATLSNDGSDHVINLNGGPMVLNDVAISAQLDASKHELYSGAGWLTIGGAMDVNILIATNPGRVIKVNKELTGNNLVVDWTNAPTGAALQFDSEAMMEASKDNIVLGSVQGASSELEYEGKKATLAVREIYTPVTSWSDLNTKVSAMTSGSYTNYRVTGNASDWVASASIAIPAGVQVTVSADKNSPAIVVSSGVSPFTLDANTVLTLENLVVGGTDSAKAAHMVVPKTATLTLNNTTLQYFEGQRGGAVHVNCGTLNATGSTFANNSNVTDWGGAIGIWGGTVNVSDSVFTGNTSKYSGGAIINYKADGSSYGGTTDNTVGNLSLTNCVFTKNTTSEHGGAVASWAGGTTTITGCTFESNSVTKCGGAIHVTDSHRATIANCTFTSNTSGADGGAVYHKSSVQMTVTGGSFTGNKGTEGGAISTIGNLQVSDTKFMENQSTTGRAGALMIWNTATVEINNCVLSGNTAKTNGGAVAKGGNSGGVLEIIDCDFNGNSAPNGEGGALMLQSSPTVTITGSTFTGNSAKTNGGVIKNNSSTTALKIENCEFSNNTAGGSGGVLYQQDGKPANLMGCIFTGNTATGGNAVHSVGGTVTLTGGNIQEADCSGKYIIVKE